ncbi:MAG: hypothetical protein QM664_01040 [Flavihumibacter sp.]
MHLLYVTFGNNNRNHTQAYFSIYSFWAKKLTLSSINIITDKPRFYKSIENKVNIIEADEAQLLDWKGEYGFFWRIKIKAIEKICSLYAGEPVMYLDSDTFFWGAADIITQLSGADNAVMWENEGTQNSLRSKTMRRMTADLKNLTIGGLSELAGYDMWNAGVVFTPNKKNNKDIEFALTLCDEMCRHKVKDQYVEQFALSVALQVSYGLQAASGWMAHYWSNKEEWNDLIREFFLESKMEGLSFEEELLKFSEIDFRKHPVVRLVKNRKRRLLNLIEKSIKDRKVEYLTP